MGPEIALAAEGEDGEFNVGRVGEVVWVDERWVGGGGGGYGYGAAGEGRGEDSAKGGVVVAVHWWRMALACISPKSRMCRFMGFSYLDPPFDNSADTRVRQLLVYAPDQASRL